MRNTFSEALYQAASANPDVYIVVADISPAGSMGGGVIYSALGGTHHTQEDIAIAGALPNMQIIAPCDPAECTKATLYCAQQKKGPVYLRLGKAGEPNFTDNAVDPWEFGR